MVNPQSIPANSFSTIHSSPLSDDELPLNSPGSQKRFPSWLFNTVDKVLRNFDIDHAANEDDDSEEEDVEGEDQLPNLLWAAQMELVNHNTEAAIVKLERAYRLNSSAAALALGSLFARGARSTGPSSSTSPKSDTSVIDLSAQASAADASPSHLELDNIEVITDVLISAKWYILGLEIELKKPLQPSLKIKIEEDNHEGTYFSRERTLDLVIGLTDGYRFGVLRHDEYRGQSGLSERLWLRGQKVAADTLNHPGISIAPTATLDLALALSPPIRSSGGPISIPASLPSRHLSVTASPQLRANSPRRTTPSAKVPNSPSLTATNPTSLRLPPPALLPTAYVTPHAKRQLAIQLHLYFILAIANWSVHRDRSEEYWKQIVELAAKAGGAVGTKEGDDIVQKATKRLRQINGTEVKDNWKLPKKSTATGASLTVVGSVQREDALSGIWRLKAGSGTATDYLQQNGWTATGADLVEPEVPTPAAPQADPNYRSSQSDTAGSRPSSVNGSSIRRLDTENTSTSTTMAPSSPPLRSSKFHFAEADYPSPPVSPRLDHDRSLLTALASDSPALPPSTLHRRQNSSFSFRPPPRLVRTKSSASVSTLPSDFFSAHARRSLATVPPAASTSTLKSYHTLNDLDHSTFQPTMSRRESWTNSLKSKATSLRSFNPFRGSNESSASSQKTSSAMTILKRVLKDDDNSGMYWADEDAVIVEGESDDEAIVDGMEEQGNGSKENADKEEDEKSTPRTSKSTKSPRAFVDPTSSSSSRPLNPAAISFAPVRSSPLSPFATPASPPSTRLVTPFPTFRKSSIDPLLLALERASRVGMKTKCASCQKKGLNFPCCNRCKQFYCSRECRVGEEGGGGDGKRHICDPKKAKGKEVAECIDPSLCE